MATPQTLATLLTGLVVVASDQDRPINGLCLDSRRVRKGDLFLAMPGGQADGRDYIHDAVSRGATAVIYENGDSYQPPELAVPVLPVSELPFVVGLIADRFFGSPSHRMTIIGVTGTNGKTTCTQLLAQVLDGRDKRCGVIGTLGNGFPGALDATSHTTPDAVVVHTLLADYLAAGAAYVCIEVSSHALEQGRIHGVAFDVAVFTNLSRDHLDYHGDMERYGAAKASLFDLPDLKFAVINEDDAFGHELIAGMRSDVNVIGFGLERGAIRALEVAPGHEGLALKIVTPAGECSLQSKLFGRFNAANLLAVLAVLLACDIPLAEAVAKLSRADPAVGRMERFGGTRAQPLLVVDYAHTPDALEKVLRALREHAQGKLWCVFGCGGDRDHGKRPQMGEIAETLADRVVLTDDNPRHEAPEKIVDDILAGMQHAPRVIHRRSKAIRVVVEEADADDIILVAGKGHEDYQQFGDERVPYSDRQTVLNILGEAA